MEQLDEEKTEESKAWLSPVGWLCCCASLLILLVLSWAIMQRRRNPAKHEVELGLDEVRELKRRMEARAEEEYGKARALVASAHALEARLKRKAGGEGGEEAPDQSSESPPSGPYAPTNDLFTAYGQRMRQG